MRAPGHGCAAGRRRDGPPVGGWRWCAGWRRNASCGQSSACRRRSYATWPCSVRAPCLSVTRRTFQPSRRAFSEISRVICFLNEKREMEEFPDPDPANVRVIQAARPIAAFGRAAGRFGSRTVACAGRQPHTCMHFSLPALFQCTARISMVDQSAILTPS